MRRIPVSPMVWRGLMCLHQTQPRRYRAAGQAQLLGQFQPRQVLQPVQNGCLIDLPLGDLPVAMIARLQHQIIRLHSKPKAWIVHRLKPVVDILYIVECSHYFTIAQPDSARQLLSHIASRQLRGPAVKQLLSHAARPLPSRVARQLPTSHRLS